MFLNITYPVTGVLAGTFLILFIRIRKHPVISTSTAMFGSYDETKLIYGSDGRPTGIDPSALYENSLTIALNLEDYADTINAIIATTPVPEPAETAFLAALLSIAAIAVVKRKR